MSWVAVAMVGAGVAKSEFVDRPKEERQRKLAASTQRFSPWTGLKANPIQEADPFGSALQYGTTGAILHSNIQNSNAQQDLMKSQSNWLNSGGSPQYTAMTSGAQNYGAYGPSQSPWGLGQDYSGFRN